MIASNPTFIIAAYTVTWAVLLGYLLVLARRGARGRAEYERMARELGAETQR